MTVRLSTGAQNGMAGRLGFAGMFNKGYVNVYTGTQPASADAAATGTLLGTISLDAGALTKETRATGSIQLTGGASGSVNSVTVGGLNIIPDGVVAFNTSLNQTASDLCDAINRNGIMEATVSTDTVTLKGRPGTGVTTAAVTANLTTITASYVNMGSGVAGIAPVNGLILGVPTSGVISRPSNQIWRLTGLAVGTAGWARLYSSDGGDTGALLSAAPWYPRLDGSCGVGSNDFQLGTLAITVGLPVTLDTFSWTQTSQ